MDTVYAVTPDEVGREARRRILSAYPLTRQAGIRQQGGAALAEMEAEIARIRFIGRRLSRLSDIPLDYRDDRHWRGAIVEAEPVSAEPSPVSAEPAPVPPQAANAQPAPINVTVQTAPVTVTQTVGTGASEPQAGVAASHSPVAPTEPHTAPLAAISEARALAPPAALRSPTAHALGSGPDGSEKTLGGPDLPATFEAELRAVTEALWSPAQEIAAEAAVRALKGHQPSLDMVAPVAQRDGLDVATYCERVLMARGAAHTAILALDDVAHAARSAFAAAITADKMQAAFSAAMAALNAKRPAG